MSRSITFRLEGDNATKLERLRRSVHAESHSHTIRLALTLLQLASNSIAAGGAVILRDADGSEQEVMVRT